MSSNKNSDIINIELTNQENEEEKVKEKLFVFDPNETISESPVCDTSAIRQIVPASIGELRT